MASTSGGVSSYHRTGSSARSNPAEHLQTIQSGIQADWDHSTFKPTQPSWISRNDSTKAHYMGSAVNVGLTRSLERRLGLHETRKPDVWRAVAVEFVATAGLTFLSITAYQESITGASLQALIYSFAILAAAPVSGGHLNPAITLTTLLTGHATLVRSLMYAMAQISGGILGATAVRFLTSPDEKLQYSMGGCVLQELSKRQGLVAETVFSIIMLFVVYGVGFDTRSVVVTFPIISPFVIGGVFGILMFISQQGVGYTVAMNPARCLGPAVVIHRREFWEPLWVFAVGPVIAAVVVGFFQVLVINQGTGDEFGPVLPLNFFQTVTPDHQRPGFGPQSVFYPTNLDHHDVARSEQLTNLSEVPNSASEYSLTLQIKAFMKPKGLESTTNSTVDVARVNDQNLMLQQHANSSDGIVHHTLGDPEKDR